MDGGELGFGGGDPVTRRAPRRAALDALERLLRAHAALSAERQRESPYGILRPAREDELDLIEAVFLHCGVPLPPTLRAIYARTVGIGNPVGPLPVLAVPFLRAALPDEGLGLGASRVGIEAFEQALGLAPGGASLERPPVLLLGHAEPVGLFAARNGLWSLEPLRNRRDPPGAAGFRLVFEDAFCVFADRVLLQWANDLAGAPLRPRELEPATGAEGGPAPLREAMAHLLAPRPLHPRAWGDVQALEHGDLLRATRRGDADLPSSILGQPIAVVGLPYAGFAEVADRIGPGTPLRLRPVDDNPHDPQAVEAWFDAPRPVRVGFVARGSAPLLRALPDGAEAWRLRVEGSSGQALACTLERVPPPEAPASPADLAPAEAPDLFSLTRRAKG